MNIKQIISIIFALFLCIDVVFSDDFASNSNPVAYINQAATQFNQKNISGAESSLSEGIKHFPNNPQLYLNRGFLRHFMQNYSGALADYNNALQIDPNYAFAYNNRGVLKVSMNDTQGALQDYEIALRLNPNYSDVYYNRANLKYMLDDFNGAMEDYDKAIALNPKDAEAYNNRGVVKKRMNFNVGALSDYSQAIAINPKDSIAYANRGRLKKLYFDNEGAAIDLNQAVALAENQAFIKNVKPLLSNRQYIAAIPSASTFTEMSNKPISVPRQVDMNQEKLAMYAPQVQNAKEKPVQKVIEPEKSVPANNIKTITANTTPNKSKFNAGVKKITIKSDTPDIRTAPIMTKATTNIKLAESYYIRGLQKCILKDLEGAIADLNKAIENNSKYADAYFYRAAIRKELGDKEGFRQDYAAAIQINPSLQTYNDANALSIVNN